MTFVACLVMPQFYILAHKDMTFKNIYTECKLLVLVFTTICVRNIYCKTT